MYVTFTYSFKGTSVIGINDSIWDFTEFREFLRLGGVVSRGGSTTDNLPETTRKTKDAKGDVFLEVALSLGLGLSPNAGKLDAIGIALNLLNAS